MSEEKLVEVPVEEEPVKSDEDLVKEAYLKELESANLSDKDLENNLKYMMNMGYLNYRINYNLLTRNNNDLIIAINKLCNNIVSDSMFINWRDLIAWTTNLG